MTTVTMLASTKLRLGIPSADTQFDTHIAEFLQTGTGRLYPSTAYEVAPQDKAVTVDSYGEATVDLSTLTTPLTDVRSSGGVEVYDGLTLQPVQSIFRHGTQLRLRNLPSGATSVRLYGLIPFALTASAGTTTIPDFLQLPVIWYAMAEFFEYMASNKAKYNIYVQTSGARGTDNMMDVSVSYEQRADQFVEDKATLYGA